YALAEAAAADKLGRNEGEMPSIEVWGREILSIAGQWWGSVKDGLQGAVEVAVIRNVISHGGHTFTRTGWNRMNNLGTSPTWSIGDAIPLSYDALDEYRARLKSLLRNGQVHS
ncbi:MAG: hypothetical protein M3X11_16955, partial [Acidobacteriota bacterium]|nr:hypothetical protein [Acidobacteriota bacterium]